MTREVVVVSGVRTAIGTFGGSLKDTPPTELASLVVRESLARAGVDGKAATAPSMSATHCHWSPACGCQAGRSNANSGTPAAAQA